MKLSTILIGTAMAGTLKFTPKSEDHLLADLLAAPIFGEACQAGAYPDSRVRTTPGAFVVDLDAAPEDRWADVGTAMAETMQHAKETYEAIWKALPIGDFWSRIAARIPTLLAGVDPQYIAEIKGFAAASGIEFEHLLMVNIFYEVGVLGTSIVSRDASGQIVHGQNLDFFPFMGLGANGPYTLSEVFKQSTIQVTFQSGGEDVFSTTSMAGYIGASAAVRSGFSLSTGSRFNPEDRLSGLINYLLGKGELGELRVFASREVFEQCEDFGCAKEMITNKDFIAPGYFTLAGTDEACIITRNINRDEIMIDDLDEDETYIMNANFDNIDINTLFDNKRAKVKECMGVLDDDNNSVFDTLSTKPLLNYLTVRSVLLTPSSGQMSSFIRDCPGICSPF